MPRNSSNNLTSTFDNDFKAEVIAAEIVENGLPAERVMVMMLGSRKRSFRKDVDSIATDISDYDHKEYTLIKTHKEGIYDMLPEGLFHNATAPKSATTKAEIIKFIKQHRVEEYNARLFFLPFEAAINHLRTQMALYENRLDKRSHYEELVNIFSGHWDIFKYLDSRQSNIFLHLIPIIHNIRDDHPVIETVMEMIFLLPIQLVLRRQMPVHPAKPIISNLGNCKLGINLITCSTLYATGENEILITLGPLQNEILQLFMPGSTNSRILELLCDYLLPVDIDIKINYELRREDRTTRLADKEYDFNSVMGLSTYL